MKKAFAVLGLCSCLLPTLALADEIDDLTDKLLKSSPLKCYDDSNAVATKNMREVLPDLMLEGIRGAAQLDQAWKAGNDNYRQARDLTEMALQDDEAKNGPIVDMSAHRLVRTAIASWTPAQRKEYLAFLKQKGGRLYWEKMADTKMCRLLTQSLLKPPYPLPPGAERDRIEKLDSNAQLTEQIGELELSLLPSDQRAKLEKQKPALQDSMVKAFDAMTANAIDRMKQAMDPVKPEMVKIIKAYQPKS